MSFLNLEKCGARRFEGKVESSKVFSSVQKWIFSQDALGKVNFDQLIDMSTDRLCELARLANDAELPLVKQNKIFSELERRGVLKSEVTRFLISGYDIPMSLVLQLAVLDNFDELYPLHIIGPDFRSWYKSYYEKKICDVIASLDVKTQDGFIKSTLRHCPEKAELLARSMLSLRNSDLRRLSCAEYILSLRLQTLQSDILKSVTFEERLRLIQKESNDKDKLWEYERIRLILAVIFFQLRDRNGQLEQINLVHQLYPSGHFDAMRMSAEMWPGYGPLSFYMQYYIHNVIDASSVNLIIEMVEGFHCISKNKKELLISALLDASLGGSNACLPSTSKLSFGICSICQEETKVFNLPVCTHGEENCICAECNRESILKSEAELIRDKCPSGCNQYVNRQILETTFGDLEFIRKRMSRLNFARMRNQGMTWQPCLTPDCISGRQVSLRKNVDDNILSASLIEFKCGSCNQVNKPNLYNTDRSILYRLLLGLKATNSPNGVGVFRECYHCASPGEKDERCMHINCSACGNAWVFDEGAIGAGYPHRFMTNGIPEQGWRPLQDGMLARIGIYQDIPHGVLNEEQKRTVQRRTRMTLERLFPNGL